MKGSRLSRSRKEVTAVGFPVIVVVTIAVASAMIATVVLTGGCGPAKREVDVLLHRDPGRFVKPTIAVLRFENRAPFPYRWNIGSGLADMLTDRLVQSGRFNVVERPDIPSVLKEVQFQRSSYVRKEGRVLPGRIKSARYLVKGVVTDFGHVSSSELYGKFNPLRLFAGSTRAVMSITIYVIDVESGEIISSASLDKSVRASQVSMKAAYKNVTFGGAYFYKTPLGKATRSVLNKAVKTIVKAVASQRWKPKIALIDGREVILNGGRDRHIKVGDLFTVRARGEPIIDPDTGDILGYHRGRVLGTVSVTDVAEHHSTARVLEGRDFAVGQLCERL